SDIRVLADAHDDTRENRYNVERSCTRDQRVALGAWIQPHFPDLLLRDLLDYPFADFRRHIDRRHVDRAGDVEHRPIRFQSFDFMLVWIDRHDRVALPPKRPDRAVSEFLRIARGTDDGDHFAHNASIPAEARHHGGP